MKAKLIKHKFGYNLVDTNGEFIATSKDEYSNGINLKYWLSKQNCDEIFGVVDVEKLAEKEYPTFNLGLNSTTSLHTIFKEPFINGFNKAMELNKEKLFTLEDVRNAIELAQGGSMQEVHNGYGISTELTFVLDNLSTDEIIQSIQQPKEIDVEVVTLIDYFDSSNKLYLSTDEAAKYCTDTGIPYTDSEGNLILIKL
jgi:hypothetical protein